VTELIPSLHELGQTIDKKGVMKCESALHVIADDMRVVKSVPTFFYGYLNP
jgi:hypothetical protein